MRCSIVAIGVVFVLSFNQFSLGLWLPGIAAGTELFGLALI